MTQRPGVAFLHTADVHVATFSRLLADVAPEVEGRHLVDDGLLGCARSAGLDDAALIEALDGRLLDAAAGDTPVLCTCSTLSGLAERRGGCSV